jgi:HlyD family secretion protein
VVLVVAAAAVAAALSLLRSAREREAAPALAVATVERRDLDVAAESAGLVEPVRVVEVKSKASGEVLEVAVESGERVEQGALLATIDPRDVQNALDQAEAEAESARVQAATAAAERARLERLRAAGLVPEQEYEQAVEAAAAARATLLRAETNLRLAAERRGDVTLRAPIAGTVLERTVEPGQLVASATANVSGGSTLFRIADLSRVQVRAKVDEVDIGRLHPGQEARVTVEAYPDRGFRGEVGKIEPQAVVEQNVTLFPVIVLLDNREGLLRPGMNAEVSIAVASRDQAVAVPSAAVVSRRDARTAAEVLGLDEGVLLAALRGDGEAGRARPDDGGARADGDGAHPGLAFVQGADGPEPRRVVLGLSDWEYTEVISGLEPGEQVVLVSVTQLQQRQQEATERFRRRAAGPIAGTGGSTRRSGGGGGR